MSNSSDLSLRMEPGILNVVTLRLMLDRGDGKQEEVTVRCHTYYMSDGSVELWRCEDGRLVRFANYNRVLNFEKLDE